MQRMLFTDEPKPPDSGSDTSKAAAKKVPNTKLQRQAILAFLRERSKHGATDHEIRAHFSDCHDEVYGPLANESTQRPRRWYLAGGNEKKPWPVLIVDSGRTRPTASGCDAKVWVVK